MAPIAQSENDETSTDNIIQTDSEGCLKKFGIKGAKKWFLFGLITFLIFLVLTNLALTLWILSVMKVHPGGMGQLTIIPGGVQLLGRAVFMDTLIASTIKSGEDRAVSIDSFNNFTIRTLSTDGTLQSRIFLDDDKIECQTNEFSLKDSNGKLLFRSTPEEVELGVNSFKITGEGGAIFDGSISTPLVKTVSGQDLTLESLTRSLSMTAAEKIKMASNSIDVNTFKDIRMKSTVGSIIIEASRVQIKNLVKSSNDFLPGQKRPKKRPAVYQLCVCENGRLFLAGSRGVCETGSDHICQ